MVIDKILAYEYGNSAAAKSLAGRITATCQADLVYYAVLKAAFRQFGTPGPGRDIENIHADVLGAARDQMAMMASDQKLLEYDGDGLVRRFRTTGQTENERLLEFARRAFMNSEGIRTMISSHISDMPEYKGREMDDNERVRVVDRLMSEALWPDSDFMMELRSAVDDMTGGTMGMGRDDRFAMRRRQEEIVGPNDPSGMSMGSKRPLDNGETRPVFKISPLMPELRNMRILQAGGIADILGLNRNQHAVVARRTGSDGKPADPSIRNNAILMYDPEKRIFKRAPDQYSSKGSAASDFNSAMFTGTPVFGSVRDAGGRLKPVEFEYFVPLRGDEDHPDRVTGQIRRTTRTYNTGAIGNGVAAAQALRMANILEKYSQEQLTDDDYSIIWDIFSHRSPNTIFGDPVADPDGTARNADAYFDYIEHVCKSTREHMSSHEFCIHLERHDHFKNRDSSAPALVPLLYFTGERTDDYNQARSNPARYFGIYPYADYVPASMDSTPLIGDVAPATFNSYTVTKGSHRRGGDDVNDPEKNRYAHAGVIDTDLVADMRSIFDGYMGLASGREGLEIAKVRRPVGDDMDIEDLSKFVLPDGSVDGPALSEILAADMDAIKRHQVLALSQPEQQARMQSVFSRFIRREGMDPGSADIGDAVQSFLSRRNARSEGRGNRGPDPGRDAAALARRLEACARMELDEAYGKDMGSVMAAKHVYGNLLGPFARRCTDLWHERDGYLKNAGADGTGPEDQTLLDGIREHSATVLSGLRGDGPDGGVLGRSMDELFGRRFSDGRVVIRANMCRSLSRHFLRDDYNNLLSMLSHSSSAGYEPSASKGLEAARDGSSALTVIQRYATAAYDITDGVLDDEDMDREEREEAGIAASEEKLWFDATFASTEPVDGRFEKTLAWLDSDFSGSALDPRVVDQKVDWSDPENPLSHALFEATHPLQCRALRDTGRKLAVIEGGRYDPSRLAVSDQGLIYYKNESGEVMFKCGPVTDEAAYVRPYTWYADSDDEAAGRAITVELPDLDAQGRIRRDEKGKVLTAQARIVADHHIYLDDDGRLMNPVAFGALDTRSLSPDGADENIVLNRFYGLSAKVGSYDGYDHGGASLSDRVELSSYKNSVMEGLDLALSVYAISRSADHSYSGELTGRGRLAMSVFYTNTGANALRKCYQTNTFIIEEKPKCAVGDSYMSRSVLGGYSDVNYDPEFEDEARACADLLFTQAQTYHNMVVFAKIALDQNIGLYNQGMNIQQGLATAVRGDLDRKNLRNHDCMSARAAYATPNRTFDVALTGTAKNLGARAFLSDAASFDWETGRLVVSQPGDGDKAGNNTRASVVSIGVTGFDDGGIRLRPSEFPDGQALDRLQLSMNAFMKAVHCAADVRFGMVNFGWNMEDGYIIAKRSARKFGHFDEDGTFHDAVLWDKIGDTESGNKGVIAKIVDTDIGAGIADDAEAGHEFLARYMFDFLPLHQFNHGSLSDSVLADGVSGAIRAYMDRMPGMSGYDDINDYFAGLVCEDARTVATAYGNLQDLLARNENGVWDEDIAETKAQIYGAMRDDCLRIAEDLMASKTEPFYGACKLDMDLWQFFRDNQDMDMAVTNVCVCTRSNPSLLMHITQNLDKDNEAGSSLSSMILRDADGNPYTVNGAAGTVNVYVDSHTADSKNIDYTTGDSSRPGRGLGAQETYALQAKNAVEGFLSFLMMNDPTRPDAIAKMNRKLMMNGFMASMSTNDGSNPDYRPFQAMNLPDALDGMALTDTGDGNLKAADGNCPAWPYKFVDMDVLAAPIAEAAFHNLLKLKPAEAAKAVEALGSLDFSKALDPDGHGRKPVDDMLHRMFESAFGRYGGGFMVLPDGASGPMLSSTGVVQGEVGITGPDGEHRTAAAAPLFLSAREVTNMESELVASHIDDKLQFRMFKSALAIAVAGQLENARAGDVPVVDSSTTGTAMKEAFATLSRAYKAVPEQPSLSLDHMNSWLKKNIYKTVNPQSLTCVWSGSPDVEIDEAGLSFEKARTLGLLHERDDLTREQLDAIPDTYECMTQRYKPVSDADLVIVNRSPGQTTGCIRALRLRIIGPTGDGLKIHPALASVFDGDFDGDTVGVANVDSAIAMGWTDDGFAERINAMRREMSARLSMNGSLLHDAEYMSVSMPDGTTRDDVHPLFIAGNADFAWAKRKMTEPDPNTGMPACGYSLDVELERAAVMANLSDQAKQMKFDRANLEKGLISQDAYDRLTKARNGVIDGLSGYFKNMAGIPGGTALDGEKTDEWRALYEKFERGLHGGKPDMAMLESLDRDVCRRVKGCYREMTGYLTGPSMAVHGDSHHEMLYNVIEYANAAKKGKLPQLNALLMFSGVHADCPGEGPRLRVEKAPSGKGFVLAYGMTRRDPEGNAMFEKICDGKPESGFDPEIRLDNIRNMGDLKETQFRSKEVCNLVAQADKSDATGKGGTLAQRMQMLLAPAGYGRVGLVTSGPITQKYLDAKQNANDCETNLTIGNSVLGAVYHFQKVHQLSEDYIEKNGHDLRQVYKGQFTVGGDLTLEEGVAQLDRFRQMMGQPPFSEIDRAELMAGLERFVDEKGILRDPLSQEHDVENVTYTAMYSGAGRYPDIIRRMVRDELGIYSGAPYESAAAYCVNKTAEAIALQRDDADEKYGPTEIMKSFQEERNRDRSVPSPAAIRDVSKARGDEVLEELLAARPSAQSGSPAAQPLSGVDWLNAWCAENPVDASDSGAGGGHGIPGE